MYSLHDEEDDNADQRETDQSSCGSTLMQRIAGAHQQTRTDDACEYLVNTKYMKQSERRLTSNSDHL